MVQMRQIFTAPNPTGSTVATQRPAAVRPAVATTPVRRTRLNSKDAGFAGAGNNNTPVRRRLHSRDMPTSPTGANHVLKRSSSFPTSIAWMSFPMTSNNTLGWSLVYLSVLGVLQLLSVALVGPLLSTTVTNVLHTFVSILSLHWIKGQPFDETGHCAGYTLWEQLLLLEDDVDVNHDNNATVRQVRCWLWLIPTLLTYAACAQCHYEPVWCAVNVTSWVIALVAKLPVMKGVRIFGINRTVGIDDYGSSGDETDADENVSLWPSEPNGAVTDPNATLTTSTH
jgi:hypothetical protein